MLMFQNMKIVKSSNREKQLIYLMISNEEK